MINISVYSIVYSRFNILSHLQIATLMVSSLHSSLNGTYIVDELYEINDTSNQNCYGLGPILESSLNFKQSSYLRFYQIYVDVSKHKWTLLTHVKSKSEFSSTHT